MMNLWSGKAVVDLNPLHGDVLMEMEVSKARVFNEKGGANLNTAVVGINLSVWSNWTNPLQSLGGCASLTCCVLMSNWNKRSVDVSTSGLNNCWSSEGLDPTKVSAQYCRLPNWMPCCR